MKILVVDDEKLLVKGIKFNLENEGYTVDACYDGATAVQMAAQGGYDLIVLDLMMPGLDGLEACQRIRESSTVPIIMLTARSEDADKLLGFESGADDYITKPFNILELKARIRALLRRAGITASQPGGQGARLLEHRGLALDTDRRAASTSSPVTARCMSSNWCRIAARACGSLRVSRGYTAASRCSTSAASPTRARWRCASRT